MTKVRVNAQMRVVSVPTQTANTVKNHSYIQYLTPVNVVFTFSVVVSICKPECDNYNSIDCNPNSVLSNFSKISKSI